MSTIDTSSKPLPLRSAAQFALSAGLEAEARAIPQMVIHPEFPKRDRDQLRKNAYVELFESKGLMEGFCKQCWPSGKASSGELRMKKYRISKALNDQLLSGVTDEDDENQNGDAEGDLRSEVPSDADLFVFGLEAQLRDFIIKNIANLPICASKLELFVDSDGRNGKEYVTEVGRIDILAVDKERNFYVFELKLTRGPDRTLGQLARYMGWIKIHLAGNRDVQGVIVARDLGPELRYAASVFPNVRMFTYEVEFKLNDVLPMSARPANCADSES